ncbi:DUF4190 domain-containing protein [Streptomyces sp. TRM76323]|uniref:DUF4190 domain-containing protein n=1 Tax=Streptomyces tamarix TaxID=3078565 RepID=A0ABU3QU89_9ACTN|nr:DUF4190 domain-containing protein [Streptomyces tamarix]MDT9686029.1 DUF4190 domain-containing protein [Streptomyces tamarix]
MSHPTQQPQYGAPHPAPPVPAAPARNGLGTAALVLGIIGTVSGFIPLFFWLAGILGLLALILGLVGRGRAKRGEATNKGVTTAGAILGLVALILSVVGAYLTYKAVDTAVDEINKELSNTAPKDTAGGDKGTGAAGDAGGTDGGAEGDKVPEVLSADETIIYDDDLKITVSAAKSFTPSDISSGHTAGNKAYKVTVVVENGSKEKFDADMVLLEARAGKDGVTAEQVYDDGLDGVTGTVAPGKKATGTYAFDVPADAKTLTVEVTPGFEHEAQQWELKF